MKMTFQEIRIIATGSLTWLAIRYYFTSCQLTKQVDYIPTVLWTNCICLIYLFSLVFHFFSVCILLDNKLIDFCWWLLVLLSFHFMLINVEENRRGNQEWTILRNWKHWRTRHKMKTSNTQTQHNTCRSAPCALKHKKNHHKSWYRGLRPIEHRFMRKS